MNVKISDLTLEEKMHLLIGSGRWDMYDADGKIPHVSMNDGPHGLRKLQGDDTSTTIPCHAYPNLSLLASSWDPKMVSSVSSAIADECIQHGTDILLAPGINIKRMPLCGRNFEYFSEDPLLSGTLGKAYIEGVQSKNVLATVKHFCANNQETYRSQASSEVDERTLNEIYFRPFEIAMEAKPACVMCSYNAVNGTFVSENQYILKEILREKLGFDGMLMSDWFAVTERARALKATLDLQMPEDEFGFNELKEAFDAGFITEEEIDASVERILKLVETCVENRKSAKRELSDEQREQIAVDAVANSVVLLKNEGNLLPLKKGTSALVAGCYMDYTPSLGGGGSSLVVPIKRPIPLHEEMRNSGWFSQVLENRPTVNIYAPVDVGIVTVGNRPQEETEAWDRTGLRLRSTDEQMIRNVARSHEKTIVILYSGGVVDVSPWIDDVDAVIWAGFGGEGVQKGVLKVLTGEVSPSGKLAETWPICVEDTVNKGDMGDGLTVSYNEGVMVGYRYYEKNRIPVRFAFGHGLSYTTFDYSDLKIEKNGDTDFTVSFKLTNTGSVDAAEVAQLYVGQLSARVARPQKELRAFEKVFLRAGESKMVTLSLDSRAFAFYSTNIRDWYVDNDNYRISIGSSSADIRLQQLVSIELPKYQQFTHTHRNIMT